MSRYIDAEGLVRYICLKTCERSEPCEPICSNIAYIREYPEEKGVKKVVHCPDCRYVGITGATCGNVCGMTNPKPDGFCSCGEPKTEGVKVSAWEPIPKPEDGTCATCLHLDKSVCYPTSPEQYRCKRTDRLKRMMDHCDAPQIQKQHN